MQLRTVEIVNQALKEREELLKKMKRDKCVDLALYCKIQREIQQLVDFIRRKGA